MANICYDLLKSRVEGEVLDTGYLLICWSTRILQGSLEMAIINSSLLQIEEYMPGQKEGYLGIWGGG